MSKRISSEMGEFTYSDYLPVLFCNETTTRADFVMNKIIIRLYFFGTASVYYA